MFAINAFILALIACALGVLFASQEKGLFSRLRDVLDIIPLVVPKGLRAVLPPNDPRHQRAERHLLVSTLKTIGGLVARNAVILLLAKNFGWQDQLINETAIALLVMNFMSYWHSANTALFMVRARRANPGDQRETQLIELFNECLSDARKFMRKELVAELKSDPTKAKQLQKLLSSPEDMPLETPWLLRRLRNVRDGINFVFDKLMPKLPEFQRRAFARFLTGILGLNRLSEDPELYVYDGDSNAFASGPLTFMSVMAVSSDLLEQWLPTDPEVIEFLKANPDKALTRERMKAILCHELGHIYRRDIMVNAIMSGETTILSLLLDVPFRLVQAFVRTKWIEAFLTWLKLPEAAKALGLDWLMRIVGQLMQMTVSQLTKINLFFVIRSRESGADGFSYMVTGEPLHIGYALYALVGFVMWRREQRKAARKSFLGLNFRDTYEEQRRETVAMALRTITFIDGLYDSLVADVPAEPTPQPKTGNVILDLIIKIVNGIKAVLSSIKRAWDSLFLTHPSIRSRILRACYVEYGEGGYCPILNQGG
ncbi:MAG: M48 family metalloprotease [Candidatus Obscuribacterales bacterium]|nr:M48 family metalloprotease [Candidatus Obscuribacterales bacterium]